MVHQKAGGPSARGRGVPTPFLAELAGREAHLDQQLLQQPAALIMPGLQAHRHIGGVQHGFIQAPVPHQREAVVIYGAAAQQQDSNCRQLQSAG